MKKLRLLLSFVLLCVGANVMAQYGHFYNDYIKDGITYKLYRNDSGSKRYAWIYSIASDAEEIIIPEYVVDPGIDNTYFPVVGFYHGFTSNCPNTTTIRVPMTQVEPSFEPVNSNYPNLLVGFVQGDFKGMPLLKEFYFNETTWNLRYTESGTFNGGLVSIASFAGDISVFGLQNRNGWKINEKVKNYYLIPNIMVDGIGYRIRESNNDVVDIVSVETDASNLVIPHRVTYNGLTYRVSYLNPYPSTDVYFSPETKSSVKAIEVENALTFNNVNLTGLSNLEKITFHGDLSDLSQCSFYDKSHLIIYTNLTTEEIRDLQASNSDWESFDVRPLNATPPGGVISGSVYDWLRRVTAEQTIDLSYLRPIGKQDSYDWEALKDLCDGTRASVQTLDLSNITLAEGLEPNFEDFSTLDTLYLPRVPMTLPDGCFNGCKPSLVVIASSPTPYATASENSFGSSVQGMTLIAPSGALYTYRTSEPWNQFGTIQPTEWAGNATISLWAGACNAPVELWAGGEKVCTVSKDGGVATQTIQMPKTVELRIPVAFLDKILINSNDVTALLPSTEPTGEAYSGYRFYTVEDVSAFTAIEVKVNGNAYMTQSMMFTISGGPGTANVTIDYADGTSETFDMEHDGESGTYHPLNFYSTTQNGRMYATTRGIKKIVVIAHPNTDEFEMTLFDAGKINQTQAENGEFMNYTAENDGSGTYTYTLLGENMTSSYVLLTFPGTMQNDVKTTIAVNGNYQVKYFFWNFDDGMGGSGYYNVKLSDDYISGTTTVSHDGSSGSYGSILIFTENAGLNPNFRVIMNGEVIQCGNSSYEYSLTWGGDRTNDYDLYMNYELGDGYNKLPYYILTLEDANIASDSWIIIDDGSTPLNQIVSPLQVAQTARVIGGGSLSLRNSEGTEVASVSEGEPSTLNWPKGDDLTLAVTLPDGADIANYDAFLFIDGTCNTLQKVDGTAFAPYSMGSINTAHTIILVIKQTGGFETPDIIEFADANVKAICVENWDTNGDGELSKAEAAAVWTLKKDNGDGTLGEPVFKENTAITSFEEFQYFTGLANICQSAFYNCSNLTSIALPPSVTTIAGWGFCGCYALNTISLPESLITIGQNAFNGSGLQVLFIPKNVSSIASGIIGGKTDNLTSVVVDKDNSYYTSLNGSNGIFKEETENKMTLVAGCQSTTIPEGVTSILGSSFYYQRYLKTITLPSTLSSIGEMTFYCCSTLESVASLAKTPPTLGSNAFYGIKNTCVLTVPYGTRDAYIAAGWTTNIFKGGVVEEEPASEIIEFADAEVKRICVENWDTNGDGELSKAEAAAVTTLKKKNGDGTFGDPVFKGNTNITSFEEFQFFTGLTSVEEYAFSSCRNLTSVIVPKNVETTQNSAFSGCRNLSITLPEGLTELGPNTFNGCYYMKEIRLPESLTTIARQVFYECYGLKSLFIPKNVTSINVFNSAISSTYNLISISVDPENTTYDSRKGCNAIITTATNYMVYGCQNTVIPEDVTQLYGFRGQRNLKSIVIPKSVTSITATAFIDCTNLTSVVAKGVTPPTLNTDAFKNISANCVLTVPYGTRDAYIAAGWTTDIFKGGVVEDKSQFDTNGDSNVSIADVTTLVNVILGKPIQ